LEELAEQSNRTSWWDELVCEKLVLRVPNLLVQIALFLLALLLLLLLIFLLSIHTAQYSPLCTDGLIQNSPLCTDCNTASTVMCVLVNRFLVLIDRICYNVQSVLR
jgi:hypothetical protein